jgi:hypothetical protein
MLAEFWEAWLDWLCFAPCALPESGMFGSMWLSSRQGEILDLPVN